MQRHLSTQAVGITAIQEATEAFMGRPKGEATNEALGILTRNFSITDESAIETLSQRVTSATKQ